MKEKAIRPEAAAARLARLSHDVDFRQRVFAGDAEARAEWNELIHISAGGQAPTGTAQSQAQTRLNNLMADPAWRTRYVDGDVAARDEMRALNATLAGPEAEGEAP